MTGIQDDIQGGSTGPAQHLPGWLLTPLSLALTAGRSVVTMVSGRGRIDSRSSPRHPGPAAPAPMMSSSPDPLVGTMVPAPRTPSIAVKGSTGAGASAGVHTALGSLGHDIPRLLTPRGMAATAREATWWILRLSGSPWSLLRPSPASDDLIHFQGLSPAQRGLLVNNLEAAGTPVLLVHNRIDSRVVFMTLSRQLRRRGFARVVSVEYSPATNDIRRAARALAGRIESVVVSTGYQRVHVIGHGVGGLIARYYVQCNDGDERVHTLITLGSPHSGSLQACLLPLQVGRQLRPGSELMAELAMPSPGCRTRFVAYWSDLDQMIVPHEYAQLQHPDLDVRNILVHGAGHLSLPRAGWVAGEIAALLGGLDPGGYVLPPPPAAAPVRRADPAR